MKKEIFLFTLSFILISCSNNNVQEKSSYEETTLKYLITQKQNEINWTQEIDGEELRKNLTIDNRIISKKVNIDFTTINSLEDYVPSILPSLNDFTSLDVSSLAEVHLNVAKQTCLYLRDNLTDFPKDLFEEKYYFTYEFFKNDLIEEWQNKFETNLISENQEKAYFDSYLIGQPFYFENQIIIPLQMIKEKKYANLNLFIDKKSNKIYQIQIDKLGVKK